MWSKYGRGKPHPFLTFASENLIACKQDSNTAKENLFTGTVNLTDSVKVVTKVTTF